VDIYSPQNYASLDCLRKAIDGIRRFDLILLQIHTLEAMITNADIDTIASANGMLARAYTDADLFDLEMERIFRRAWIFVGHESHVPNPGDFRRTNIGTDEVLLVRQKDHSLKVLSNSCAHRGTQICTATLGNAKSFVCPYHAWAYDLSGALKAVPNLDSYPNGFEITHPSLHLKPASRVESYRGFVFASLSEQGPSLIEFLGKMTDAIDNLVERSPTEKISAEGGHFKVRYPGNWKLHHENANDTVHPGFVHESSVASARQVKDEWKGKSGMLDQGQSMNMMISNGLTPKDWNAIELNSVSNGHSFMGGFYRSGLLAPRQDDEVTRSYREALQAALGKEKAAEILGMDRFNNLIWPNLNVNAQFHQVRVVHPIAVDKTVVEGFCFRLDGAPEEIFHRAVRFLGTLVSPASMIFSDDLEIFRRVQLGLKNGDLERLDSRRGIETDKHFESSDTVHSTTSSELPLRAQAAAWKQWMSSINE